MTQTFFIRQKKEKDYTVINNTILKDPTVSWKAKGLFVYLLSLPEDWVIYLSEIEKHATDGKDSLRAAIKELTAHGYIIQQRQKNERGQFDGWRYEIIEDPGSAPATPEAKKDQEPEKPKSENPQSDIPQSDIPQSDIPQSENPLLLNTNNNKILNKQITNESGAPAEPQPQTEPKEQKHKHGEFENVLLTDKEINKLIAEHGEARTKQAIQYLSEKKEMKGYKYKSDYLALKNWVFSALTEAEQRTARIQSSNKPTMTNDIYRGDGSDW